MDIDKIASSSSLITPELEGQMQGVFHAGFTIRLRNKKNRRNWILLFCLLPGCTGRNSMPAFRFTESPEGRK